MSETRADRLVEKDERRRVVTPPWKEADDE